MTVSRIGRQGRTSLSALLMLARIFTFASNLELRSFIHFNIRSFLDRKHFVLRTSIQLSFDLNFVRSFIVEISNLECDGLYTLLYYYLFLNCSDLKFRTKIIRLYEFHLLLLVLLEF